MPRVNRGRVSVKLNRPHLHQVGFARRRQLSLQDFGNGLVRGDPEDPAVAAFDLPRFAFPMLGFGVTRIGLP